MSNISITPANVVQLPGASTESGQFGETITAGQAVYKKPSDGKFWKAICSDAAKDNVYGIALNGGNADALAIIQRRGDITIGGTVVQGTVYVLSATAGGICPWADLVSTNYVTIIGVGLSTTAIRLVQSTTNVQK